MPHGIFSKHKYQFGNILEVLVIEMLVCFWPFGILYDLVVNVISIRHNLWSFGVFLVCLKSEPFGIFCGHLVYFW
jgi:hypothetical protein